MSWLRPVDSIDRDGLTACQDTKNVLSEVQPEGFFANCVPWGKKAESAGRKTE
jgi:hypothetical protein